MHTFHPKVDWGRTQKGATTASWLVSCSYKTLSHEEDGLFCVQTSVPQHGGPPSGVSNLQRGNGSGSQQPPLGQGLRQGLRLWFYMTKLSQPWNLSFAHYSADGVKTQTHPNTLILTGTSSLVSLICRGVFGEFYRATQKEDS